MSTKLFHLYALLVGALVHIVGWFLVFDETENKQWRNCSFDGYTALNCEAYGHRTFGVAVIFVSLIFVFLVVRDARKQMHD
jgi:hypothetical protein